MKKPVKRYNLPNILSAIRILAFPFLVYLMVVKEEQIFAILFCASLVTDILDGAIARIFKMQTALGAKLDSLADIGIYISAFAGIYIFKWEVFGWHKIWLLIFLFLYLTNLMISLVRFGKFPNLHLYSFKITGYLQGIFFFVLFAFGFNIWIYYVAAIWGILACTEEMAVLFKLSNLQTDVKGLYWLLREEPRMTNDY